MNHKFIVMIYCTMNMNFKHWKSRSSRTKMLNVEPLFVESQYNKRQLESDRGIQID